MGGSDRVVLGLSFSAQLGMPSAVLLFLFSAALLLLLFTVLVLAAPLLGMGLAVPVASMLLLRVPTSTMLLLEGTVVLLAMGLTVSLASMLLLGCTPLPLLLLEGTVLLALQVPRGSNSLVPATVALLVLVMMLLGMQRNVLSQLVLRVLRALTLGPRRPRLWL